ncbi:MAG: DUF1761 domain-containing protein [Betaproteobacteria bacterium]|nr:MAG: DUF1761 domain-containing protein [Betaproteobacteria bacterium]
MLVDLVSINWWAVLLATIVAYAIGAVWYAPPVFGKRWMAALGKSGEQLGDPAKLRAAQFFLTLVIASVLAAVVVRFGAVTWIEGAAIGFVLSAGFVGTSLLSDWMSCSFNMRLYWMQIGYRLVCVTAMGAILGAWR